jgi:hypothetical protein
MFMADVHKLIHRYGAQRQVSPLGNPAGRIDEVMRRSAKVHMALGQ